VNDDNRGWLRSIKNAKAAVERNPQHYAALRANLGLAPSPRTPPMTEKRQTGLTMTPIMWAYIEQLRLTGLYGDSTSTVLRTLIMKGVEQAIANRIITLVKP
jgi:hypothetical protein